MKDPYPSSGTRIAGVACILALLTLAWAATEAFDNVLYTAWLRAHIHWFTPTLPVGLILVALKRKARRGLVVLTLLLVLFQYGLLYTLHQIGQAGASVWQQL